MNDLIHRIDKDELAARSVFFNKDYQPIDFDGFVPECNEKAHVIVVGTDRRMLFMLRQAALLAHYLNFDDETGSNRTTLTLIDTVAKNREDLQATKSKVDGEDCLCNLTKECPWSYGMWNGEKVCDNQNGSYVDIDLRIVGLELSKLNDYLSELLKAGANQRFTLVSYKEVLEYINVQGAKNQARYFQTYEVPENDISPESADYHIDLDLAKKINVIYLFSNLLGDLQAGDIDNVKYYSQTIHFFIHNIRQHDIDKRWNNQTDLCLALSNVYCADGIYSKIRGFHHKNKIDLEKTVSSKLIQFAKCEHTRWCVEKLIIGFRAWDAQESYKYEFLYDSEANDYKNRKKKLERAHIDICSNRTLRRIDIASVKYDNFLMLAIPHIISFSVDK